MICLGIESTAHTFGIGIITDDGKVLANERDVYKPKLGSGIVPNDAAAHHRNVKEDVLNKVLEKSGITFDDIDIVAYSAGPGIPPCLHVGADFAVELSKKYNIPLVPVNHCIAHLEIGKLSADVKDPVFVYLSGGNTQIIAFTEGRYRIFGETEDIPVGNALDVVAREMNLPMPGGVEIERLAKDGKYVELPYVVKGMDLSFTGITTAASKKFKGGVKKEDVAFNMQETCFAMITEVTERALAHTEKNEVLLVGGVAVNKRLQNMMEVMCEDRDAKMCMVPQEFAGDNGVMISWAGILSHKSGQKLNIDKIDQSWRTDEVEIDWV